MMTLLPEPSATMHHDAQGWNWPSPWDVRLYEEMVVLGDRVASENFDLDGELDEIILKPWGHEYRVYADTLLDVWRLDILPGERTSMHCHPRKETALLCLSGIARIRLLGREYAIFAGETIALHKGVFHSIENPTRKPLQLVELETPRNKLDRLRIGDKYGRVERDGAVMHVRAGMPLTPVQHRADGKIRAQSLDANHEFTILTGHELKAEVPEGTIFLASLAVANAFRHEIEVLTAEYFEPAKLCDDERYLVIKWRAR